MAKGEPYAPWRWTLGGLVLSSGSVEHLAIARTEGLWWGSDMSAGGELTVSVGSTVELGEV